MEIQQQIKLIKREEEQSLRKAVMKHGAPEGNTTRYAFSPGNRPMIATYLFDDPCDAEVLYVDLHKDYIRIKVREKGGICQGSVEPESVFAGHIESITDAILYPNG